MNILFVAPMPMIANEGGIQRVTCTLKDELFRQGHKILYLCCCDVYKIPESGIEDIQHHIHMDLSNPNPAISSYQLLLKNENIDCVIFQWVEEHTKVWLVNTPPHIKTIAAIHQQPFAGYGYERLMYKHAQVGNLRQWVAKTIFTTCPFILRNFTAKYTKELLRTCNEYADVTCFLSKRYIPRVLRFCPGLSESKLWGIGNPLTFPIVMDADVSQKENIILFVGRIENAQKNIYGFVDIWKNLSLKNPEWKAVVVGDGNDLPGVRQYVEKKQIQRISFCGNRKDVNVFYKRAKIMAITSFWEGFSMVLTEAMSYGCVPVVFDSYEALYDIVDDKKSGLIIPAFNNTSFAESVQMLIDDERMREKMGSEAMQKVQEFAPGKIVLQWMNLICSIKK